MSKNCMFEITCVNTTLMSFQQVEIQSKFPLFDRQLHIASSKKQAFPFRKIKKHRMRKTAIIS